MGTFGDEDRVARFDTQLALYVERETKPHRAYQCRSFHPGPTLTILRMARRAYRGETRYADLLASERNPVVLEMEIQTRWSSAGARRGSEPDR